MEERTITQEERSHWGDVLGETYPIVLEQIVRNNLTKPENMGRAFAALVMLTYACEITVDGKQEKMIDWEENYLIQCFIDEMVTFRYLSKWTFGHGTHEEDEAVKKQWNEFYLRNEKEVNEYSRRVAVGFAKYIHELHDKYPMLQHTLFDSAEYAKKRAEELKSRIIKKE